MHKGSLFSIPSPTLVISHHFDHSHSNRCEMISPWYLTCISLTISDVEHLFMYLCHPYIFFGKTSIQIFCPFFNQVVCFSAIELCEFLYILDINPVSDIHFANIFSHFVGCLFICWWFPLLCRSFLVWCSPTCWFLCFFVFLPLLFCQTQKSCQEQCQGAFCSFLEVLCFQVLYSSL